MPKTQSPNSSQRSVPAAKLDRVPVFYTPLMVAVNDSFSPSAGKPKAAVDSWVKLGIPVNIVAPEPVSADDFARAHLRSHVDAVLACRSENGFGNRSQVVAKSLPYTSGAMLAAAREAMRNSRVAVAPVSGFHHAGHARCGGYCTFNGLMVAAMALHSSGEAKSVGILDFDQHYGDGTDDIIRKLRVDWVRHFTAGQHYGSRSEAEPFLKSIPALIEGMKDCDVILYQAGADPHIDDPLGGWLTTDQLHERDRLVFEVAARLGIPIAWNLAGGYQKPLRKVLMIHDNTMKACAAIHLGLPRHGATTVVEPAEEELSEPPRRIFRYVSIDAFDARRGYQRCMPTGVGMNWESGESAVADFWNDRAGRLVIRCKSGSEILHLEVTHNDGRNLSDADMGAFQADVIELLMEWLVEGTDEMPDSCYYQDDEE